MKLFKSVFYFFVEPIFKKIILKIDSNVTIDDHLNNVSKLKIDLKKSKHLFNKSNSKFKTDDLKFFFLENDNFKTLNLELFLIDKNFSINVNCHAKSSDYINVVLDKLKKSKINGNEEEKESTKSIFRALYFITKNNLLDKKDSEILVKNIILFFPIKSWLYPNNLFYGSSNILLGLVHINKNFPNPIIDEYLKKVSERILKKMEISQNKIFDFSNSPKLKSFLILEQNKFISFLLFYYQSSKDIRFLNAVLKANDRLFSFFKKLNISSKSNSKNTVDVLLAHYYINNIEMQELNFSKLI